MKLKKGIAAITSVFAIGAVGAQMLEAEGTNQQPEEAPIVTVDTTTTESLATSDSLATSESMAGSERVVVAQAEQPRFTQRSTVRQESYRTVVPGLPLPPAASPRSGENSGEEIATRTMPVDIRAQLSPDYLTDHSPGL